MKVNDITSAWRCFFFAPQSVLPLAVYRILFGLLVLQMLLVQLGGDFTLWYGPDSIVSFEAIKHFFWWDSPRFDLLLLLPKTEVAVQAFHFLSVITAVLVVLGLGGRYSVACLVLILISLHHHNPYNINGGDVFLRLTGVFLAFSRCCDALSIDALLRRRRHGYDYCPLSESWPQRMIQLQICIAYAASVAWKLSGAQWVDGTAVYYALRLQDLMRVSLPLLSDWPVAYKFLTWSTLVIETAMFTLVWVKEFRYYVLLSALCLHLGIDVMINLPIFEWAFIFGLTAFFDARTICGVASSGRSVAQAVFNRISSVGAALQSPGKELTAPAKRADQ